jgi:hypothetical protein
MSASPLPAPAELTLPATAAFLERLLSALGPVQIDLAPVREIDLAGLQLLAAIARDPRMTFTSARPAPLVDACIAAGLNPSHFDSGDLYV